jgi:hypothetical protein
MAMNSASVSVPPVLQRAGLVAGAVAAVDPHAVHARVRARTRRTRRSTIARVSASVESSSTWIVSRSARPAHRGGGLDDPAGHGVAR